MAENRPQAVDAISENAATLKTVYPHRSDKYGMKFRRGFRTALQVSGKRPVTRAHKRPSRG